MGLVLRERDYEFPNVEVKKYAELPFDLEDILDIRPVIKYIEVVNQDSKHHMDVGEKLIQDDKLPEALEMFQTAIQILFNLYGPYHKESAYCYNKIAFIYYKQGKYDQAILYQKITIKNFKKLYGMDHYQTAHAYLHLGVYFMGAQIYDKAQKYLMKALFLKQVIGGESYPDLQMVMMNLSLLYQ